VREAIARVDAARVARRIDELAAIGLVPGGGVTRLGLSREEERARELVASWLRARGASVRRDEAANLIARVGGSGAPFVVASHLDSVPNGGRFDGALGVLCAVEAVDAMSDAGVRLPVPLEVVAWTDEEGARFGVGLFGSAAAYGRLPPNIATRSDADGVTVGVALRELGFAGEPSAAKRNGDRGYLELHIEQGPRLEREGRPVGVVSAIVGLTHARVTVEGSADHAGTTAMPDRHDAFLASAELALALEADARRRPSAVATVGEIAVRPGAKNVVPGTCVFSVDVRAPDDETRRDLITAFHEKRRGVEAARGVRTSYDVLSEPRAVALDTRIRGALSEACRELGADGPELISGAGHDAQNAQAAGVPAGMLFIRSRNGSHNPAEDASAEDAAFAVRALLLALERLSSTT
jgi:allantoate deiminase